MSIAGITGNSVTNVDDPTVFESTLSPDALMVYLSSRLKGIDGQVDNIFNEQKKDQRLQEDIHTIQAALARLDENASGDGDGTDLPKDIKDEIAAAVHDMQVTDPVQGGAIAAKLYGDGFILSDDNLKYNGGELKNTKPYIDGVAKDLESSAQMNMIHLQSLMSDRQTAIQLATNLISALGESSKAIAANVGK